MTITESDGAGGRIESPAVSLTDFLLARIAEDEAVAREAVPGPWVQEFRNVTLSEDDPRRVGAGRYATPPTLMMGAQRKRMQFTDAEVMGSAAHIARHDPARALAECQAKRQIVAEHGDDWGTGVCNKCRDSTGDCDPAPCRTLRALALPYADHPDYREEWHDHH